MKLRLLITSIFIISTIFIAMHEVEHINHHDTSSCQVCIVDDHSQSGDIINVSDNENTIYTSFDTINYNSLAFDYKNNTNQNRAPSKIS